MRSVAYWRGYYEAICVMDRDSKYRRYREYAGYVDRFLHSHDVVDGVEFERRRNELPMPMTVYFMG